MIYKYMNIGVSSKQHHETRETFPIFRFFFISVFIFFFFASVSFTHPGIYSLMLLKLSKAILRKSLTFPMLLKKKKKETAGEKKE